ncbi:MAG: zinc-binding dehydrogenase [Candidatus Omnitrophica bacterium]|nr:zinc-binding dehydrogenase [Candidatus Omnitrophota bacterium]
MYKKGKAVIFKKPKEVEIREIRLAEVDDGTIVVKTKYSGISTGTEMAVYRGEASWEGVWYPCVPGYEEVGEVVYVGKNAFKTNKGETLKVGDRVMANEVRYYPDYMAAWGGQCEYAIKNQKTSPYLMDRPAKIPENVSYQEAVIAYLASVAKKGIDMVKVNEGESFLVIGMGVIGLSAVQLLKKIYKTGKVIAGDINDTRLKIAKKYTDFVVDLRCKNPLKEIMDMNDGKKVDVVFEASGNPKVIDEIFDYVRPGGRIHLQGQYRQPIVITRYSRWNCSDLVVSASIALNPGDKEEILKLISEGKFDAKSLYTKEYFIDDAYKAYKELEDNKYDILKILFKWEE